MSMLDRIFSRSQSPRDVDSLIRDIADHQRPDDYSEFFRLLPELQLFPPSLARCQRAFLGAKGSSFPQERKFGREPHRFKDSSALLSSPPPIIRILATTTLV